MNSSVIMIIGIVLVSIIACNTMSSKTEIKANAFLVDVRTPKEFARGSVSNAINIPLSNIESQLSSFEAKDEIVVFCRSGNRSGKAKKILESHGIKNVINGGSWKSVSKQLTQ